MSQNLDIIQAYNDPDTRIRILLGGDVVTGCVVQDTSLQASVQWNDPLQQLAEMAKQKIQQSLAGGLQQAAGVIMDSAPVQVAGKQLSVKSWVASSGPTLPLTLLFLAVNPSDDVRIPINKIMKYVWPEGDAAFTPPGGYQNSLGAVASSTPSGVITVEIGKWFSAKQIMLISNDASPTYSKEVISSGLPLWSSISVTFTPYRAINYDDWMSFFP